MFKSEIIFSYIDFEAMIKEHEKDMKKQIKSNLSLPKKVIVYDENGKYGFRYEY